MNKFGNSIAYVLSAFVVVVALLVVLDIWGILDFDNWKIYLRKTLLSFLTIGAAGAFVMLIFNIFYKEEVRPPRPPGDNNPS